MASIGRAMEMRRLREEGAANSAWHGWEDEPGDVVVDTSSATGVGVGAGAAHAMSGGHAVDAGGVHSPLRVCRRQRLARYFCRRGCGA